MPTRIGRYEIVERLGHGGIGFVVRGHDPVLDRDAAIKIIHRQHLGTPDLMQTFLEEAAQDNPESIEDYRIESRQIELQLQVLAAKLQPLEQRIFDMESDLRGRQAEIHDWEDLLDDALGLR